MPATCIFMECWPVVVCIKEKLLADNGSQISWKYFVAVRSLFEWNSTSSNQNHSKLNGQKTRFNFTSSFRLGHYISEHHIEWKMYLFPLTYVYNLRMAMLIAVCTFVLVFT